MFTEEAQQHLILYENCQVVKGLIRSSICDLFRNDVYLIPNSLADILFLGREKNLQQIQELVDNSLIFDEYVEFIIGNELGFICSYDELEYFPTMDISFETPNYFTNSILDFDEHSNVLSTIDWLLSIESEHVQIRIICEATNLQIDLRGVLAKFDKSKTKTIEVYIKYDSKIDNQYYIDLLKSWPRLNFICLYDARANLRESVLPYRNTLILVEDNLDFGNDCGQISASFFAINLEAFTESRNYNSCLNGKVSIDRNGKIKNCPSMIEEYGSIDTIGMKDLIDNERYISKWKIKKDEIKICNSCEFRYICTDCRAYLEDPDDILSKPLKCGYDPYTGEWSEWSTNPLKQKAIDFYGMRDLIEKI